MATLRVGLDIGSGDIVPLTLPVDVRAEDYTIVAKTLSADKLQLSPGRYFLTIKLPDGNVLSRGVTLGDSVDALVVMSTQERYPNPVEFLRSLLRSTKHGALSVRFASQPSKDAVFRLFKGNVLQQSLAPTENLHLGGENAHVMRQVLSEQSTVLQVECQGGAALNVVLPVGVEDGALAFVDYTPTVGWSIDVLVGDLSASLMLLYLYAGHLEEARALASSSELMARGLQRMGEASTGACAVGYALLRLGLFEELRPWVETGNQLEHNVPDALIICSEFWAREGAHEKAARALLRLANAGIPAFVDGLGYALGRLQQYTSVVRGPLTEASLLGEDKDLVRRLLSRLRDYASAADLSQPVLSFEGVDPSSPLPRSSTTRPPDTVAPSARRRGVTHADDLASRFRDRLRRPSEFATGKLLGDRARKARDQLGVSREELAVTHGISVGAVKLLESGLLNEGEVYLGDWAAIVGGLESRVIEARQTPPRLTAALEWSGARWYVIPPTELGSQREYEAAAFPGVESEGPVPPKFTVLRRDNDQVLHVKLGAEYHDGHYRLLQRSSLSESIEILAWGYLDSDGGAQVVLPQQTQRPLLIELRPE